LTPEIFSELLKLMRIVTVIFLALTALYGFWSSLATLGSSQQATATFTPNPYNSISALITLLGSLFLLPGILGVLKGKSWGLPVSIVGLVLFVIAAVLIGMGGYVLIVSYILPIISVIFLLFSNKK